jgi:predicted nuclease with TOPRIM domain
MTREPKTDPMAACDLVRAAMAATDPRLTDTQLALVAVTERATQLQVANTKLRRALTALQDQYSRLRIKYDKISNRRVKI